MRLRTFPMLALLAAATLARSVGAVDYFTRLGGGARDWNANNVWSTAGCGGASAGNNEPGPGDTATVCNGHAINLNGNRSALRVTINAGGTLNAGANTLTLTGTTGTLLTRNGTFNPGTSTVIVNGSGTVTLNAGTVTFNNLTLAPATGALTVNLGADINVNGATTISASAGATATLDTTAANHALTSGTLAINANGTLVANGSTVTLDGGPGTLFTLNQPGGFVPGSSTVVMSRNANATLTAGNSPISFHHLRLGDLALSGNRAYGFGAQPVTVNGDLTINVPSSSGAGTIRTLTVTLGAAMQVAGITTVTAGGDETAILDTGANRALTSGQLVIGGAGTGTRGVVDANGSTITLNGNTGPLFALNATGRFTQGTSTVVMNGQASVELITVLNAAGLTFNSLTMDMPGLTGTLGGSVRVDGTLAFDGGVLATGDANTLTIWTAGLITGAGPSRHVTGNLEKRWGGTGNFVYAVGDGTAYTPVSVNFTTLNTAGLLTVTTPVAPAVDHPVTTAGLSPVEPTRSVNRYWTFKNSTLAGTFNATFSYPSASVDAGAAPALFVAGRGTGCGGSGASRTCTGWTSLTAAAASSTAVTVNGQAMTVGGAEADFVLGEARRIFVREPEFIYHRELY